RRIPAPRSPPRCRGPPRSAACRGSRSRCPLVRGPSAHSGSSAGGPGGGVRMRTCSILSRGPPCPDCRPRGSDVRTTLSGEDSYRLLIGGDWVAGGDGSYPIVNPATEEVE